MQAAKMVAGLGVGGLLIVLPATAFAAPAGAATPAVGARFQHAQKALEAALAGRQQRLGNLTTDATNAADLTSSDRSTLKTDLGNETQGIDALVAKVPTDTTFKELWADGKSMVDTYRVYLVMSPQVHLTIAADTETAVENKLQAAEPQIEALIQYEQSQGKNVQAAQTAYEDMVTQVSDAATDTSGVSAAVLATSPADYPANQNLFANSRSSLDQAHKALMTARADVKAIVKDLGI